MSCANESKLKASRQELIMLQNLLNVIEEKCEDGRFPEEFRGKIYSKSNFLDAYNQVELFSRDYNLNIPASIVPSLSHTSTSNSISLQPLNLQANTTFANNYEPRETLIQNLSFSQTNPKHYIESPQLRKYEPSERPQFVATSEMPRSAPFSQIQSPRFPQPPLTQVQSSQQLQHSTQYQLTQPVQPSQIKFNFQPQSPIMGASFAPRRF
jgi:hypothetical protein